MYNFGNLLGDVTTQSNELNFEDIAGLFSGTIIVYQIVRDQRMDYNEN